LPAQKARRLLQEEFNQVFKLPNLLYNQVHNDGQVDILLVPSATSPAPTLAQSNNNGSIEEYIDDVMTLPANLAGIPAITVPFNTTNPIGLQLLGQYGYDKFVLRIAQELMKK
jgi:aspartyl-tRNA(Asn)/glutamyl-tRNA(Gln) amidotransferase subunit A